VPKRLKKKKTENNHSSHQHLDLITENGTKFLETGTAPLGSMDKNQHRVATQFLKISLGLSTIVLNHLN
jgi:hypothetical protein